MFQARQGDVLFIAVKEIPGGLQKKRLTGHILEGEATGHIHRIAEPELEAAEVLEIGERLFLNVSESGVSIVHEDHAPVLLPEGTYEVLRQREYSPEAIRKVVD